ncbi:MAG: hypothetical protein AB7O38_24140 [Pirellulaceae bacterium]
MSMNPEKPTPREQGREQFYFVCDCGAKWFSPRSRATCPRCGRTHTSGEILPVPWLAACVAKQENHDSQKPSVQ